MTRFSRLLDDRPRTREALAALLLWLLLAAPLALSDEAPPWLRLTAAPLLAAAAYWARRAPLAVLAVPTALGLALTPDLLTETFTPALAVLSHLLGRRSPDTRPALLAVAGLCATGLLLALTLPGADLWGWFTLVATVLFAAVLPWLLGRFRRQQAELQRTGWELAARMEREQQLIADRTRLRERSRIAGDMHDSLGHDLSLIAVRAAALQVAPGMDDAARGSAAELRQAAADATERLREILGVLRQDAAETAPTSVTDLVERATASGIPVHLHRHGTPDPPPLPPLTASAVHRVIQEAITNAAKHAPGNTVTVTLTTESDEVTVAVADTSTETTGTPTPPIPAASGNGSGTGAGTGLIGLDERVRLAGGTFQAHPTPTGFRVTARLPLTPGPTAAHPQAQPDETAGISQRELTQARQRVRRGMADAIWIPVAAGAALFLLVYGFEVYTSHQSVLKKATYDELHTSDPTPAIAPRLPGYEFDDEAPPGAPADPADTDECRFYRTATFTNSPLYRLCFTDGRLSHKDRVTPTPDDG
ncbi:histidine kinase [Streptomyces sp. NBC_01775]|uniref:sensor histidine kinase n=1 Tax=Streptomyces sp. NBC_01775 TaxID=2975939 RepID=UPI002DDB465B|nr:histidine kinase [Streptomyces sp. NBC_01775]WSB77525.1 histidine kinase [Streptomyces sp. NBC_01775]